MTDTKAKIAAWKHQMAKLDTDQLDTLIDKACTWFKFARDEDDSVEALETGSRGKKATFILSFTEANGSQPESAPRGLFAFLDKAAARGLIEAPADLPSKAVSQTRARTAREAKPARRERETKVAPVKVHSGKFASRLEVHIAGRASKIVEALGFKKHLQEDGPTILAKRAAFTVVADETGVRFEKVSAADLSRAARFLRHRLAEHPAFLSRARVIPAGGGDSIKDEFLTKAHVRETSRGFVFEKTA